MARARPAKTSSRPACEVLNRALHAFRLVTADPYLHPVDRDQAIVARLGFGVGEQVADGLWTDAREIDGREPRRAARGSCIRRPASPRCSEPARPPWPARSWPCAPGSTSTTAATARPPCSSSSPSTPPWPSSAPRSPRAELADAAGRAARAARRDRRGRPGGPERARLRRAAARRSSFTLERIESALRARAVANA